MRSRKRVILLAATVLLAMAGFAAGARARSVAKDAAGSDADTTATDRALRVRAREAPSMLADVIHQEPAVALGRPDPWDERNPYERWVRNVPFEPTHAVH
jgi:hypothetical protein